MIESALKQKIENYVRVKFSVEQDKIYVDASLRADALPRLGIGNSAYSTYSDDRHIRIQGECAKALVLTKAEILMEAYELYGFPLDDAIVEEARLLRDAVVAARFNAVAGELDLEVTRNVKSSQQANAIAANFKRQLTIQTQYVVNEVSCLVEYRRVMLSKKQEALTSITVQGPNARVNINSIDQSRNEVKG